MEPIPFVLTILIVVWSVTTHEVAHAWVADRLGDDTARRMGRITLNPLPHVDPFMTVILPAVLLLSGSNVVFGGAKPVPVNLLNLRKMRRDWALVGLAGPVSNILIALLLVGLLAVFVHTGLWSADASGVQILGYAAFINIFLAVFNMVPIPPLDGSRVVQYFLRGPALEAYHRLENFGFLILVAILFMAQGFFSWLLLTFVVPVMDAFWGLFLLNPEGNWFKILFSDLG